MLLSLREIAYLVVSIGRESWPARGDADVCPWPVSMLLPGQRMPLAGNTDFVGTHAKCQIGEFTRVSAPSYVCLPGSSGCGIRSCFDKVRKGLGDVVTGGLLSVLQAACFSFRGCCSTF